MKQIYLDNSATTLPYDEVVNVVCESMKTLYANPSSLHKKGKEAEEKVNVARKYIAQKINAKEDELYFTSGGTESNNIAILGAARKNKRNGNKIITTRVEHPSVLECFKALSLEGFECVYLDVDEEGIVDINQLKNEIDKNTVLVSIMAVNNETGAKMPIEKIGEIIKEKNPDCLFHTDCVQAFGKIQIDVEKSKIDFLSVSAHKIGGPNGVGALYIRKKINILSPSYGGGQEKGIRSGTVNVSGILGFEKACEITFSKNTNHKELKEYFLNEILKLKNISVNSPKESVDNILNVSFVGVKSEVLLHVLESKGIYVSSGSACSSHKKEAGYVLSAMGRKPNEQDSAIRFSFGPDLTKEDVDYVLDVLNKEIPVLRKIMR
ncbi:MAG: cysteine desulfurase [Ruminococcaceae bacterium]|nr:cysteine desulfurase [Oscillospiraceae bacterium]